METLRLKNYRCFDDTGDVRIKPITVLIGANSSGKSSFLKFFPLMKQSVGIRKNGVFLWYSDDVDFKDFKNAVKEGKGDIVIDMGLYIEDKVYDKSSTFYKYFRSANIAYNGVHMHVELTISKRGENADYLKRLRLVYNNQECEVKFGEENIQNIIINGKDMQAKKLFYCQPTTQILPRLYVRPMSLSNRAYDSVNPIRKRVMDTLSLMGVTDTDQTMTNLFRSEYYFFNREVFNGYLAEVLKIEAHDDALNNLYILYHLDALLESINAKLAGEAGVLSYVKPLRITPERYYRYQNYSVEEISSDGKNLAMYFASLPEEDMKDFNQWVSDNFEFSIHLNKEEKGHVEIGIQEKNKQSHNMVDTGFGYNQLLPILAIIWNALRNRRRASFWESEENQRCVVIEQPELHLHPRVMSSFAEALCKIVIQQKDIRFIIETHSDTLINRLGSLINSHMIEREQINVVIFNAQEEGLESYVEQVSYDEFGFIENWPIGFFS